MAEYIEREAAIAVCSNQYTECLRKNDWCGDTVAWNICYGIKAIPAADVAPVVRCKDCKHQRKAWHHDRRMKEGGYWIYSCERNSDPFVDHAVTGLDDEFCSYGERKNDEKL